MFRCVVCGGECSGFASCLKCGGYLCFFCAESADTSKLPSSIDCYCPEHVPIEKKEGESC